MPKALRFRYTFGNGFVRILPEGESVYGWETELSSYAFDEFAARIKAKHGLS